MKHTCRACGEERRCRDSFVSWVFFFVGVVATVSVRAVTLLDSHDPIYGKIAWYIGVTGFFVFFLYKFRVDRSRARVIKEAKLAHKIHNHEKLSPDEYRLVGSLLCGLTSGKDLVNYVLIFTTSVLALLVALYMDLGRMF